MNYDFGHYHDMDHDGDRDIKDSAMFHEMMEEDERKYRGTSASTGTDDVSKKSIAILVGVLFVIYFIAELIFG